MKKLTQITLTGAAGRLGGLLRAPLSGMCGALVSTDIAEEVPDLAPNERYVRADLAEMDAVAAAVEGAEMVVHFGAIADEAPFEAILGPNIVGAYNVWEAAHRTGARRVVYASSIHAVGMHLKSDRIGTDAPHRPDTFYGLAKCFAEDLGRLYWERRGMEAVCLRILSCSGEVGNARALGTWLSDGDMVRLVRRAVDTPATGFAVAYGVSANDRAPVDNGRRVPGIPAAGQRRGVRGGDPGGGPPGRSGGSGGDPAGRAVLHRAPGRERDRAPEPQARGGRLAVPRWRARRGSGPRAGRPPLGGRARTCDGCRAPGRRARSRAG